jgi:hypothetical protein
LGVNRFAITRRRNKMQTKESAEFLFRMVFIIEMDAYFSPVQTHTKSKIPSRK